uniref:Uncharacterized protein n=1 Tax=Lutzomyia longipalpis TaxID=7200 RepID=A0A1B0CLE3_LUTLO
MQTEDMSLDSASWESLSPGAKERKKALLEKSWVEMFEEEENAMNASLNAERTVEEGEILDDTKEAAATAECPDEDILDIDGESQDLPEEDFAARKQPLYFYNLKPSVCSVFEGLSPVDFVVYYREEKIDELLRDYKLKSVIAGV